MNECKSFALKHKGLNVSLEASVIDKCYRKILFNGWFKKSLVCLFFILITISASAQTNPNPIIGYDKLPWGTSIETVKKKYPNAFETVESEDFDIKIFNDSGFRIFVEKNNIDNGIKIRVFNFFQNKLFGVTVTYDIDNTAEGMALLKKLNSIYGEPNDAKKDSNAYGMNTEESITITWNYNSNLEISLVATNTYDENNNYIDFNFYCTYMDPIILDRMYSAIQDQYKKELGL